MKKINIRLPKKKIGSILMYLLLVVISSLLLVSFLVVLPLTEKLAPQYTYNITDKKDSYWSKEYVLELDTEDKKDITKTRNVLYRRLKSYGLEDFSIYDISSDDSKQLRVVVQTTKPQDLVDELIRNRFYVQISTMKEDVDFNNQEDPYAYLMGSNYNPTEFNQSFFRTYYLTKLTTSTQEKAYFVIFKTWPFTSGNFNKFLDENNGKQIGVDIDGFITPVYISAESKSVFAVPVSTDDSESIKVLNILYNSGKIPVNFKLSNQTILETETIDINYITVSLAVISAIIITYVSLLLTKQLDKKTVLLSLLSSGITITLWLFILKFFKIPSDLWLLTLELILTLIFTRVFIDNKDSQIVLTGGLLIILSVLLILGSGYVTIFARDMIGLILLSQISVIFSDWYINNIKKYLKE